MPLNETANLAFVRASRRALESPDLFVMREIVWNVADELFGVDDTFGSDATVSNSYIFQDSEIEATLFERRAENGSETAKLYPRFVERMSRRRLPGGRRVRTAWGKAERTGIRNPLPDQLSEISAAAQLAGNAALTVVGIARLPKAGTDNCNEYALVTAPGPAMDMLIAQRRLITETALKLRNLGVIARSDDSLQLPVHLLPFARVPDSPQQQEAFVTRTQAEIDGLQLELDNVVWSTGTVG